MQAQPSWGKKAAKSVFVLKTFKADGSLNGSSNGFFVDSDGRAISSYAPFKGAAKAVVIDSEGKELPVTCMLGANETYDVAKFRVETKKASPLLIASEATAVGAQVWLLPYRGVKTLKEGVVSKAEKLYYKHLKEAGLDEKKTVQPRAGQRGGGTGETAADRFFARKGKKEGWKK